VILSCHLSSPTSRLRTIQNSLLYVDDVTHDFSLPRARECVDRTCMQLTGWPVCVIDSGECSPCCEGTSILTIGFVLLLI
jgi:hypothetical protein